MKTKLLFALTLFASQHLFAQQTRIVPDCVIPFSFTATGSTSSLTCGAPNGVPNSPGIASWILVYSNTGFSAISLVVQSAPDNAGVPGAWATFAGTVLTSAQYPGSTGANPNTALTSGFTGFAGYYPWMRVTLSSKTGTGTVKGNLYGYLNSTLAKAGGGGGGGGGYNTIQNNGVSLPMETVLNFVNGGCVDNPGVSTDCTFAASTGTGAVVGYSSTAVTLPAAGTTYIPPVGGGLPSTTEANVQASAPVASPVVNFYALISLPPGTGNTIKFTFRDAGSSQSLTCTISGFPSTTCKDTSHTFTPTVGDLLDIKIDTTGTVSITPNIQIFYEYGAGGGGGGGVIAHHQYYTAAVHNNTMGGLDFPSMVNAGTSVTNLAPSNLLGVMALQESATGNFIVGIPSTWDSSAITVNVDAMTSTNSTGNYSLTPSYFCITNGTDLVTGVSYTSGSTVTHAAPGGTGSGFYRQVFSLTVAASGCVAGGAVEITITRGASDAYSATVYMAGADVIINY